MRPNWKEIPKDDLRGQWAGLYVSLNPKGQITFSRVTWNKMGAPIAFVILFDSVNNRIGLKPAHVTTRNAYKVGPTGKHGGKRLLAYRMMREYRISLPETIEFVDPETDEDGILILDLRTARVSERARNWRKNTKRPATVGGEPAANLSIVQA